VREHPGSAQGSKGGPPGVKVIQVLQILLHVRVFGLTQLLLHVGLETHTNKNHHQAVSNDYQQTAGGVLEDYDKMS